MEHRDRTEADTFAVDAICGVALGVFASAILIIAVLLAVVGYGPG